MEIDVDNTFTQDLTRSAMSSNLVLGLSFLDQYYSFNYTASRQVVWFKLFCKKSELGKKHITVLS